jgi:hypothetical protein
MGKGKAHDAHPVVDEGRGVAGMSEETPTAKPIPLADLKARLELLTKHGVRFYRDGVLSIDLTTQKQTAGKTPQQEFPPVPEM